MHTSVLFFFVTPNPPPHPRGCSPPPTVPQRAEAERLTAVIAEEARGHAASLQELERELADCEDRLAAAREEVRTARDRDRAGAPGSESDRNLALERELERERAKVGLAARR
jgi:hypothetical protein